jgi:iron-sulfur cluster insertion protein
MIFTEKAATRVEEIIMEQGETNDTALRVFVEGGGCHGFSYGFGFEKDLKDDDSVYETNGVKLVVDSMSIMYLADAKVDYISSLQGDRFVIDNPEAQTTCGCGSSFSV